MKWYSTGGYRFHVLPQHQPQLLSAEAAQCLPPTRRSPWLVLTVMYMNHLSQAARETKCFPAASDVSLASRKVSVYYLVKKNVRKDAIWIKGQKSQVVPLELVTLANICLNLASRGKVSQHLQAESCKHHLAQEYVVYTRQQGRGLQCQACLFSHHPPLLSLLEFRLTSLWILNKVPLSSISSHQSSEAERQWQQLMWQPSCSHTASVAEGLCHPW